MKAIVVGLGVQGKKRINNLNQNIKKFFVFFWRLWFLCIGNRKLYLLIAQDSQYSGVN